MPQKMNILYYGLSRNQGGIETYLYKLARNINRNRFRLLYMDETGGNACFREELKCLGAIFIDITPRRTSIVKNKNDLEELFGANRIDILHFNCNTLSYITPVTVALKHGIKVVLHSRNSKGILISNIFHKINYLRLNSNNNSNIKQIAVSKVAGEWLFGKNGCFEIYNNGIEIDRFRFREELRQIKRNELHIDEKHVYGNVGAFLEAKNHTFIINVFKKILERDKEAVLLLVGDGPLRHSIVHLVGGLGLAENVFFLGRRSDIPELMMAMDMFLFPSIYEGFPNAVLEAETSGLPIVMSDAITSEVMLLESCQKLSLKKTADEWADACIGPIIKDHTNTYSRKGAAEIIDKAGFSVKDEIKRIEKMYEEILLNEC